MRTASCHERVQVELLGCNLNICQQRDRTAPCGESIQRTSVHPSRLRSSSHEVENLQRQDERSSRSQALCNCVHVRGRWGNELIRYRRMEHESVLQNFHVNTSSITGKWCCCIDYCWCCCFFVLFLYTSTTKNKYFKNYALNFQSFLHIGQCWRTFCELSHFTIQCMWKAWPHIPHTV